MPLPPDGQTATAWFDLEPGDGAALYVKRLLRPNAAGLGAVKVEVARGAASSTANQPDPSPRAAAAA